MSSTTSIDTREHQRLGDSRHVADGLAEVPLHRELSEPADDTIPVPSGTTKARVAAGKLKTAAVACAMDEMPVILFLLRGGTQGGEGRGGKGRDMGWLERRELEASEPTSS